eukprot:g1525.t1
MYTTVLRWLGLCAVAEAVVGLSPLGSAPTHYGDPYRSPCEGAVPGWGAERNLTVENVPGALCSPPCENKTTEAEAPQALTCPTDVPARVTAEPRCALQQKSSGGQLVDYCVLMCSPGAPEDQCGAHASCKSIQNLGICTYDLIKPPPSLPSQCSVSEDGSAVSCSGAVNSDAGCTSLDELCCAVELPRSFAKLRAFRSSQKTPFTSLSFKCDGSFGSADASWAALFANELANITGLTHLALDLSRNPLAGDAMNQVVKAGVQANPGLTNLSVILQMNNVTDTGIGQLGSAVVGPSHMTALAIDVGRNDKDEGDKKHPLTAIGIASLMKALAPLGGQLTDLTLNLGYDIQAGAAGIRNAAVGLQPFSAQLENLKLGLGYVGVTAQDTSPAVACLGKMLGNFKRLQTLDLDLDCDVNDGDAVRALGIHMACLPGVHSGDISLPGMDNDNCDCHCGLALDTGRKCLAPNKNWVGNLGSRCFQCMPHANASVCATSATLPTSSSSALARTQFGDVEGTVVLSRGRIQVKQWLSIPYALPPTGVRRFAPPVPWNKHFPDGRLHATRDGIFCTQTPYPGQNASSMEPGQEDCLVLSIWAPVSSRENASGKRELLPIMFWIHGGDFIQGNGDQYNGTELAAKHNAVIVAINYRLGHLGWLQAARGRANFGLKDQRQAMRWVRANIQPFGGDNSRVLVFGESAGAISIATHLFSPASDGLFATALMESGFPSAKSQAYALRIGSKYSEAAGCGENITHGDDDALIACLRKASLADLQAAAAIATELPPTATSFDEIGWGPTVDGQENGLPELPNTALLKDRFNGGRADLLAGTNANEGTVFVYGEYPHGLNASTFKVLMQSLVKVDDDSGRRVVNETLLALVLKQYPPNATRGADNRELAARALADYSFTCGTRRMLAHVANMGLTAAAYRFDQRAAADTSPKNMGVEHGDEVPFVFDQGTWIGEAGFTPEEERLATKMGSVWSNFSRKCAAGVQDVGEEAEPSVANGTPWKAEEEPGREAAIQNANSLLFCQCACCMDRPSKAPRLELQRVLDELQRIGDADLEDPGDAAREKWEPMPRKEGTSLRGGFPIQGEGTTRSNSSSTMLPRRLLAALAVMVLLPVAGGSRLRRHSSAATRHHAGAAVRAKRALAMSALELEVGQRGGRAAGLSKAKVAQAGNPSADAESLSPQTGHSTLNPRQTAFAVPDLPAKYTSHSVKLMDDKFDSTETIMHDWVIPADMPPDQMGFEQPVGLPANMWFAGRLVGKAPLRSKRAFEWPFTVVAEVDRSHKCSDHFILLSSRKDLKFSWGYEAGTVKAVMNCDTKQVYSNNLDGTPYSGPKTAVHGSAALGAMTWEVVVSDVTITFKDSKSPPITVPNNLGRNPIYIYVGSDQDSPGQKARFYKLMVLAPPKANSMGADVVFGDDFSFLNDTRPREWSKRPVEGSEVDYGCGGMDGNPSLRFQGPERDGHIGSTVVGERSVCTCGTRVCAHVATPSVRLLAARGGVQAPHAKGSVAGIVEVMMKKLVNAVCVII